MKFDDLMKKGKGVADIMSGKIIADKIEGAVNKVDDVLTVMSMEGEIEPVTTADDFSGDLSCPVCVCLMDYFEKSAYAKMAPEEDGNYDKSDCCSECGTPFVVAQSYYDYIIESADKEQNKLINKDKEIQYKEFCCPDCAKKFFEKKYPGVFVTEDRSQYNARLMAWRKENGAVSFSDKLTNRGAEAVKKHNEYAAKINASLEKHLEDKYAAKENKAGLLGTLFPFLNKLLK